MAGLAGLETLVVMLRRLSYGGVMGHTDGDPTDHFRATYQRAGESMIDAYCWPGCS